MFINKGLIYNFKLICKDGDKDFSPIKDGKTGMRTETFP